MVVAVVSILEFWRRWEGLALGGGVQVMGRSGEAAALAPHRGAGGGSEETVQLPAVSRADESTTTPPSKEPRGRNTNRPYLRLSRTGVWHLSWS